METKKVVKSSNFFECIKCNYKTDKKSNFSKHLLTRKHKILTNVKTETSRSIKDNRKINRKRITKHK